MMARFLYKLYLLFFLSAVFIVTVSCSGGPPVPFPAFDFTVEDVDAENIIGCIHSEITRCHARMMSSDTTRTERMWLDKHANYLNELKKKMLNKKV